MINKIIAATSLSFLLATEVVYAQSSEPSTMDASAESSMPQEASEDGSEDGSKDGSKADPATADVEEESTPDSMEIDGMHDHGDMNHSYPIFEACLSRSEDVYGDFEGEWMDFDQMDDLKAGLTSDLEPSILTPCLDAEGLLVSLEMTFESADGLKEVVIPSAGPQLGADNVTCTPMPYEEREPADYVRMYKNDTEARVSGFGIVFNATEQDFFKIGQPQREGLNFDLEPDQHFVGFFGKQSEVGITQLGLIIQNITCTSEKAHALYLEEKMLEEAALAAQAGVSEESSSSVILIVVIALVTVILAIIIVIFVVLVRRRKKRANANKVVALQADGKQPHSAQQSLPNIETEDELNQETRRSQSAAKESAKRGLKDIGME